MREWWLRTVLVLTAPAAVFAALRDDSPETASKRSEPVLLIIWLAGMAYVLSTPTAAHLMDDHDYDALLVAIWAFLAGGLFGGTGYFLLGGALHGAGLVYGYRGRHTPICKDGRPPVAQREDAMGQVEFICHNGTTVTN